MLNKLKEKYRAFRAWQKQPHQVAPLSEETHCCNTCGTEYQGNYCPRCGQSAKVGRYSFKAAFLLFLDVWGLGNRGMFRSIRDLILRPGYMIRDYLGGMQTAYFPPFKMFFLIIALSVLVDSGLNIKGENRLQKTKDKISMNLEEGKSIGDSISAKSKEIIFDEDSTSVETIKKREAVKRGGTIASRALQIIKTVFNWIADHMTFMTLIWLLVFSAPLYLFFRKSPAYPGLRFSEFFVAMVYTNNMMNIFSVISGFFCFGEVLTEFVCYLLSIISLKQLTGYSFKRTLAYAIVAFIFLCFIALILLILGISLIGVFIGAQQ